MEPRKFCTDCVGEIAESYGLQIGFATTRGTNGRGNLFITKSF
jgi:hypothetical protein